jgi:phage N-6-adenine-methyltransferase
MASQGTTTRTLGRDDWTTPPEIFDPINKTFRFDLDAAAGSAEEARTPAFIPPSVDALSVNWIDYCRPKKGRQYGTVWLNPPYGREVNLWVEKAEKEAARGLFVVVLIPANTDTEYWQEWIVESPYCVGVIFLSPRVRFILPDEGKERGSAPKGHAIIIYGPKKRKSMLVPHHYWKWKTDDFADVIRELE